MQLKVTKDSEKELVKTVASLGKESKASHRSDADQLEETWAGAHILYNIMLTEHDFFTYVSSVYT